MADGVLDTSKPASSGIDIPTGFDQTREQLAQVAIHIANEDTAHGLADLLAVINEVIAARGTMNGLLAFLSVSHNPDGTLRVAVVSNPSEWVNAAYVPAKIDAKTFVVSGNRTMTFCPMRRVDVQTAVSHNYGLVQGSTYGAEFDLTTVTLYDPVVPEGVLTNVLYSLITPSSNPAGSFDLRWVARRKDRYNYNGF